MVQAAIVTLAAHRIDELAGPQDRGVQHQRSGFHPNLPLRAVKHQSVTVFAKHQRLIGEAVAAIGARLLVAAQGVVEIKLYVPARLQTA